MEDNSDSLKKNSRLLLLLSVINFGIFVISKVGLPSVTTQLDRYLARSFGSAMALFLIPLPLTFVFMLLKRKKGFTFFNIHAVMAIIVHVIAIIGGIYKTSLK